MHLFLAFYPAILHRTATTATDKASNVVDVGNKDIIFADLPLAVIVDPSPGRRLQVTGGWACR
ncbi:MAG: hypothetical protein IPH18_18125 [Chitinophagaceae bacterium]|nr:hypothetical protein [Chitinophagaceae bacterium]